MLPQIERHKSHFMDTFNGSIVDNFVNFIRPTLPRRVIGVSELMERYLIYVYITDGIDNSNSDQSFLSRPLPSCGTNLFRLFESIAKSKTDPRIQGFWQRENDQVFCVLF